MALNMIKLCVGCHTPEELQEWIEFTLEDKKRRGEPAEQFHTTRMIPKRVDELTDGGSLYWVMKGGVQCRQKLLDIRPFRDGEGIMRCRLVLEPTVIRTGWMARRPFQGWRYLAPEDVPADVADSGTGELPDNLRRELAELGLL
jgi:hypothetical protein